MAPEHRICAVGRGGAGGGECCGRAASAVCTGGGAGVCDNTQAVEWMVFERGTCAVGEAWQWLLVKRSSEAMEWVVPEHGVCAKGEAWQCKARHGGMVKQCSGGGVHGA
eukprot:1161033-Pelagomonas_calceolata.AAC.9